MLVLQPVPNVLHERNNNGSNSTLLWAWVRFLNKISGLALNPLRCTYLWRLQYVSWMLLVMYTGIILVCIVSWERSQIIMISCWVPKQRSAFVCFANLVVKLLIVICFTVALCINVQKFSQDIFVMQNLITTGWIAVEVSQFINFKNGGCCYTFGVNHS